METADAVKLHDDLLASRPEGARHDSDICPFCVEKASQVDSTASRIPPVDADGPDVSGQQSHQTNTEGGTSKTMSDISQEAHEALLAKAVAEATATTEKALEAKATEVSDLTSKVEQLTTENASLKADNDRINAELDTAQVGLKAAQDEVASLKADIAAKDEAAAKAEVASKRTEQVKNLGLFKDDYIGEKASAWAELSEENWSERLDEWAKLKPAKSDDKDTSTDAASAMSGTTETLTDAASDESTNDKPPARRAALGLV